MLSGREGSSCASRRSPPGPHSSLLPGRRIDPLLPLPPLPLHRRRDPDPRVARRSVLGPTDVRAQPKHEARDPITSTTRGMGPDPTPHPRDTIHSHATPVGWDPITRHIRGMGCDPTPYPRDEMRSPLLSIALLHQLHPALLHVPLPHRYDLLLPMCAGSPAECTPSPRRSPHRPPPAAPPHWPPGANAVPPPPEADALSVVWLHFVRFMEFVSDLNLHEHSVSTLPPHDHEQLAPLSSLSHYHYSHSS